MNLDLRLFIDNIPLYDFIRDTGPLLATFIGLWIALKGLSTWKRQIKFTHQYETIKELGVHIHKYEKLISDFRNKKLGLIPINNIQEKDGVDEYSKRVTDLYNAKGDLIFENISKIEQLLVQLEFIKVKKRDIFLLNENYKKMEKIRIECKSLRQCIYVDRIKKINDTSTESNSNRFYLDIDSSLQDDISKKIDDIITSCDKILKSYLG